MGNSQSTLNPTATTERTQPSPEPTSTRPEPSPESTATAGASQPSPTPKPSSTPEPGRGESQTRPFDPAAISLGLDLVADGFAAPLAAVHAGDGSGRLFVVEKGGRIKILQEGIVLPELFLDVSRRVSTGSEQGLLGLAFEPGQPERFYLNYTNTQGDTVIARYRVSKNPNVADAASEEILFVVAQPATNHNGGNLAFGPDGYLWIGLGDGGAAGDQFRNGQNLDTPLGDMVRIDVRGEQGYTIPSDNPFADGATGDPMIWAIGLRNPWR
ncbi:MAG: PQQ-dependent sugar dehydrogenase, partial [Ardenticatenales bacterium]|nr:PQQ-dependent sugar dehydrogenase [Ardenticatenales bacterium]